MAGNAAEWVADWYTADWYDRMPDQNPFKSIMPTEPYPTRVTRGGSFVDAQPNLRTSNRDGSSLPDDLFDYLGFRCAASPSSP
jgi:formylglycine-generating enzyme required for sulfatase activity